ncbi:hypothetical protein CEXT_703281 [Caerostris extrusa]|uniref:Uncharacterized protein n=1 Tax=Caerostris extrusa TaxID=172846 RepID=A0AAV4WGG3_CAEEX|nr:hypothetical protein CEXT_703281 [Caerostris extrusa]
MRHPFTDSIKKQSDSIPMHNDSRVFPKFTAHFRWAKNRGKREIADLILFHGKKSQAYPLQSGDAVAIYCIRAQLDPCCDAPTRSHDPIQNNRIRFHALRFEIQEIFPKFTVTFTGLKTEPSKRTIASSFLHCKKMNREGSCKDLHTLGIEKVLIVKYSNNWGLRISNEA